MELSNPNTLWEWIKYKARSFTIAFAIRLAREQISHEVRLRRRLNTLAKDFDVSATSDVISEVQSIKRELSEILKQRANITIFRARANWAQYGEKPTAYFL